MIQAPNMKYSKIREEELKNKVGQDFFNDFDTTQIIGNIDFTVKPILAPTTSGRAGLGLDEISLLWAEAKTGDYDLYSMFAQLIITIGKARTFDKHIPPSFLAVFDFKKIVFIPYNQIVDIFLMNDFNWNVAPSNHETKEFLLIKSRIEDILHSETYLYDFVNDEIELKFFIKNNLAKATTSSKIHIDKNNFVSIYLRWLVQVKPYISFDWEAGKKQEIVDHDFFLADLFVDDKGTDTIDDDTTIKADLFVVFKNGQYEIAKENLKTLFNASIPIKEKKLYEQFWKKYKRPPISEFHEFILNRRDLLIPQDIRERKGAFFTPQIWVELSQQYLADVLGNNWQEDYYIWDCAAGTGNLLAGLTNKYNIYASTLDQADVNVMQDRIKNGAILLNDHVFQFDFLNDDFIPISKGGKMPDSLFDIINNPSKRKKLVVYINPPYAEATNAKTVTGTGENKTGVAKDFKINEYFKAKIGNASNEIFALFMANINDKMQGVVLGQFSTLKFVNGTNFKKFKDFFLAEYLGGFIVPANTFDNVKGNFPIGFTMWNTNKNEKISEVVCDIFDKKAGKLEQKRFYGDLPENINKWIKKFDYIKKSEIGFMENPGNDFQNNKFLNFTNNFGTRHVNYFSFQSFNLIQGIIYFSVRNCIKANWLNDRDQFLHPNDGWQTDKEFQSDCLAFALFHGQNRISAIEGINHWIPFTEREIDAKGRFESRFMTDFIQGKIKPAEEVENLFVVNEPKAHYEIPLKFSKQATLVFDAGRELWRYYHTQNDINVNASLYDIRTYFQGRNEKGKMKNKSQDNQYMELINSLRDSLKILARKIEPKVYLYGFLRE